MAPGRTRQGGSLGRPGNVVLGVVTEGPAQRTGYHEARIAPVAGVENGFNLPPLSPAFSGQIGVRNLGTIWEQPLSTPPPPGDFTPSEAVLGSTAGQRFNRPDRQCSRVPIVAGRECRPAWIT